MKWSTATGPSGLPQVSRSGRSVSAWTMRSCLALIDAAVRAAASTVSAAMAGSTSATSWSSWVSKGDWCSI
ncbi:hypothetical protein ACWEKR_08330 [Nocardia sp. NPDC004573]